MMSSQLQPAKRILLARLTKSLIEEFKIISNSKHYSFLNSPESAQKLLSYAKDLCAAQSDAILNSLPHRYLPRVDSDISLIDLVILF